MNRVDLHLFIIIIIISLFRPKALTLIFDRIEMYACNWFSVFFFSLSESQQTRYVDCIDVTADGDIIYWRRYIARKVK